MRLITLLGLILTVSSPPLYAKIAKVKMMRGQVFIEEGGQKRALKKDEWVSEGALISTASKSFVRLLFTDRSTINVGPESTMKIDQFSQDKQKTGLITLVKGQIRSQVSKTPMQGNKSKLHIKTRTAAMGVRGTELQVVYNEENQVTSAVTLEGEVAMMQLDPNAPQDSASLEQGLSGPQAVRVQEGEFAGLFKNGGQTTLSRPTTLSPKQIGTMIKNQVPGITPPQGPQRSFKPAVPPGVPVLAFANDGKAVEAQVADQVGAQAKGAVDQEIKALRGDNPPPEGSFNASTGELAPPAGGFVDLKTGLYVPPPPGSEFDANAGVFVPPASVGTVGEDGSYQAPPGLELTPEGTYITSSNESGASSQGAEKGGGQAPPGVAPRLVAVEQFGGEAFFFSPEAGSGDLEGAPEDSLAAANFEQLMLDELERVDDTSEQLADEATEVNSGSVIFNIIIQ